MISLEKHLRNAYLKQFKENFHNLKIFFNSEKFVHLNRILRRVSNFLCFNRSLGELAELDEVLNLSFNRSIDDSLLESCR